NVACKDRARALYRRQEVDDAADRALAQALVRNPSSRPVDNQPLPASAPLYQSLLCADCHHPWSTHAGSSELVDLPCVVPTGRDETCGCGRRAPSFFPAWKAALLAARAQGRDLGAEAWDRARDDAIRVEELATGGVPGPLG